MDEIDLLGVSFSYSPPSGPPGKYAVDNVTLKIRPGEFLCVLGPSGCGKSTLIRLLAGLSVPRAGRIVSGGVPFPSGETHTALVSQQAALFPWMTVERNIVFHARKTRGLDSPSARILAGELLETTGLSSTGGLYPFELSGGMRQRAAIACALVTKAGLLLLDEPFSALDHKSRRELRALLTKIWQESQGKTIVFVTHDIEEAMLLGDRIAFMKPGEIVSILNVPFARPREEKKILVSPECCTLRKRLISLFYEYEAEPAVP
jgi:ABC-type nitrate/sulfonate/bicarbonate transport system ATPase subunit